MNSCVSPSGAAAWAAAGATPLRCVGERCGGGSTRVPRVRPRAVAAPWFAGTFFNGGRGPSAAIHEPSSTAPCTLCSSWAAPWASRFFRGRSSGATASWASTTTPTTTVSTPGCAPTTAPRGTSVHGAALAACHAETPSNTHPVLVRPYTARNLSRCLHPQRASKPSFRFIRKQRKRCLGLSSSSGYSKP